MNTNKKANTPSQSEPGIWVLESSEKAINKNSTIKCLLYKEISIDPASCLAWHATMIIMYMRR